MSFNTYIAVICISTISLMSCATSDKNVSDKSQKSAEEDHRVVDSEELIFEYMTMLKTDLMRALKTHSPEDSINACNQSAPMISQALFEKYGWKIGRTSLKLRNQSNAPDAWEKKVLEEFKERRSDGEAIQDLTFSEVANVDGVPRFRYMKAIPTMHICLNCHGENLSKSLKTKLKNTYPHDKAVDFKFGEIRGAFSISQDIE